MIRFGEHDLGIFGRQELQGYAARPAAPAGRVQRVLARRCPACGRCTCSRGHAEDGVRVDGDVRPGRAQDRARDGVDPVTELPGSPRPDAMGRAGSRRSRSVRSWSARLVVKVVSRIRESRLAPSDHPGPVQRHDGLAGSGAPGQAERPAVGALGVLALFGVQEHTPGAEVATLDHPAQLLVALDPGEGHLGGRMAQPLDQAVGIARSGLGC